jgi:hypothetical protein
MRRSPNNGNGFASKCQNADRIEPRAGQMIASRIRWLLPAFTSEVIARLGRAIPYAAVRRGGSA